MVHVCSRPRANEAGALRSRQAAPHPAGPGALRALLLALVMAAGAQAWAQTPPGASLPGRLERDSQREPQPARRDGAIDIDRARFPEQVPAGAASTRLTLAQVLLDGNTAIGTAELAPLWQPLLGRDISLADAFALAGRITAAYRARGYVLSQALVPQQDLDVAGARLRIRILEGHVDKLRVTGPPGDALLPYLAPIGVERPATLATLERQLLLINELPGVQGQATLQAGSVAHASDLELLASQTRWQGALALHNRIAPSQGDVRIEADLVANGLFGVFDRHSLRLSSSGDRRLNQWSWGLDAPLGSQGWKLQLGLSGSVSEPRVAVANLDTRSQNAYLGLAYPVLRSRQTNLALRAQLAAANNSADALGQRTSEDRIRALRLGLTADHSDSLGGVNLVDIEVSRGLGGLGASAAGDPLLNGARPDFTRTTVYLARLQDLGAGFSLLAAFSAQDSGDKLPTAEQMGLGGETFLRGYDPSEAIGERGQAGKLELRADAAFGSLSTTWYLYTDAGSVTRRQVGAASQRTSLSSAGLGLRFSGPARLRGYLEVAKPLGDKVASKNSSRARVFAGIGIDF